MHLGRKESGGAVNNAPHDYSFRVDKVLHNTSQEGVFEECGQDVVDSVLQGYNGTLMAYGQTGAGKTFTMVVCVPAVSSFPPALSELLIGFSLSLSLSVLSVSISPPPSLSEWWTGEL